MLTEVFFNINYNTLLITNVFGQMICHVMSKLFSFKTAITTKQLDIEVFLFVNNK